MIVRSGVQATAIIDGKVRGSSALVFDGQVSVAPNGFVIGQDQDAIGGSFDGSQSSYGALGSLKLYNYAVDVDKVFPMAYDACPEEGTPCDDGNNKTLDDREDGYCDCVGTPVKINNELSSTKAFSLQQVDNNKILLSGLVLLFLFCIVVLYVINQRRILEKERLEKRNQLETEKRVSLENELAIKQNELTAKILHLASKNEMLSNIDTKVRELQSSVDADVNASSERISRMIELDAVDNEMWDQFSKEFAVIHSDFMDKLVGAYGSFSQTEMRLISLMKMNLSSKEIMSILRISDTGLKKARYRLRKKLNLESKINLQRFFLTYER